jgi:hypothetical protein
VIGGLGSRSTIPDASKWSGVIELRTPRSPGARVGQFCDRLALPA